MKELFEKYAPWKILRHFALNAGAEFHVKELARILDMSPGTCSVELRKFEAEGVLTRKKLGTGHFYRIADNFLTREMKRFMSLARIFDSGLVEKLLRQSQDISSIALYGSHCSGDFTEKSDIDVLIITSGKKSFTLDRLEDEMGRTINIQVFSTGQWLSMKREDDAFYKTIISNHVLLHGGELP